MAELTEERLEQILADKLEPFTKRADLERFATKEDLAGFATKEDLKNFATKEDLADFATKDDLSTLRRDIEHQLEKQSAELHGSIDDLARMVSAGFDELKTNDLREKVQAHDRKFHKLEEALHIKL